MLLGGSKRNIGKKMVKKTLQKILKSETLLRLSSCHLEQNMSTRKVLSCIKNKQKKQAYLRAGLVQNNKNTSIIQKHMYKRALLPT